MVLEAWGFGLTRRYALFEFGVSSRCFEIRQSLHESTVAARGHE
jgi:hypothetical protein